MRTPRLRLVGRGIIVRLVNVAQPDARPDGDAAADDGPPRLEGRVLLVDVVVAQVELLDRLVARERVEQVQAALDGDAPLARMRLAPPALEPRS